MAALLGILSLSLTLSLQAQAPRRTPVQEPSRPIVALDTRWALALETPPAAPAGFDERTAYVPLKDGELIAVTLEDGRIRWKVTLATPFTPAAGDGLVFVAGDGFLAALEEGTGTAVWRLPAADAIAGRPYFDAGMLFVTTKTGALLALRSQDGSIVWQRDLGSALSAAPSSLGSRLYVGLTDGRLLALTRDTGEPLWSFDAQGAATGILALDDQVIVGTRSNRVLSLELDRARVRWQWKVGADVAGTPSADDRRIYFAALDNVLRAVDRGNGNLRWTVRLPSRPAGGPLRIADVVILPTVSASIGAYFAEDGRDAFAIKAAQEIWGGPHVRESARPTAPRLIAMSREGTLAAFAARHEPPPGRVDGLPGGAKVGGD
jgi:outer membrane protein assembly factor BamB